MNSIADEMLRDNLREVALDWQRRFAVAPAITNVIAESDVALLVGRQGIEIIQALIFPKPLA